MSSKTSKKSKKKSSYSSSSFRFREKASKLSSTAASVLLSPVVESEEDGPDHDVSHEGALDRRRGGGGYVNGDDLDDGGHIFGSGDGNYGENSNSNPCGVNEHDRGANDHIGGDDINYHSHHHHQQQLQQQYHHQQQWEHRRQLYPQHQRAGESIEEEVGGADGSFESDVGVVTGGETSYGLSPSRRSTRPRHSHELLQRQQRDHWNSRNSREVDRRRLKANVGAVDPPPFAELAAGGPPSTPAASPHMASHQSDTAGDVVRSGYSVAANSNVDSDSNSSSSCASPSAAAAIARPSSSSSLMPLPGFEEADLLQRAIERRALLHNRIEAMEAAKAEYERKSSGGKTMDDRGNEGQRERRSSSMAEEEHRATPRRRYSKHLKGRLGRQHRQLGMVDASLGYASTSMKHPPSDSTSMEARRRLSTGLTVTKDQSFSPILSFADYKNDVKNMDRLSDEEGLREVEQKDVKQRLDGLHSRASTDDGVRLSKAGMGEHHRRMNELSERIKREVQEFMSYESSYAEERGRLMGGKDDFLEISEEEGGDGANGNGGPRGGPAFPGGQGDGSSRLSWMGSVDRGRPPAAAIIDSSAWDYGGKAEENEDWDVDVTPQKRRRPSSQQLSRYSNMVRLQIPDVAVLRSMERDGIADTQLTLQSLKEERGIVAPHAAPAGGNSGPEGDLLTASLRRDVQDGWQGMRDSRSMLSGRRSGGSMRSGGGGNDGALLNGVGDGVDPSERRLTLPLGEDPNYSKYFKMLKAKVPISWVKRVLEVDGKDARVLDLDPNRPMRDQVGQHVDEFGNVDWGSVDLKRTAYSTALELSGNRVDVGDGGKAQPAVSLIHAAAAASVKAELAAMTAKAEKAAAPFDEPSLGDGGAHKSLQTRESAQTAAETTAIATTQPGFESTPQSTTIAAAAAARMIRLKALQARRRQSVDEIRWRQSPKPPDSTPTMTNRQRGKTYPEASTTQPADASGRKQSYEDLPLKDDPRFSKYFQMIRSRVPRSWVERVIEVDDKDPAILNLDPNKSLAIQMGKEGVDEMLGTDDTDTVDSTYISLDSRSTRRSVSVDKSEQGQQPDGASGDGKALESHLPITQIGEDAKYDDDQSETSSITTHPQEEKSNIDLTKISSFLERIEAHLSGQNATGAALDDKPALPRFTTTEEVENKLAELLENFDSRKFKEETHKEMPDEQKQLTEKSQVDIAKLSTLLAAELGPRPDASGLIEVMPNTQQTMTVGNEQLSDLKKLPSLLTQVLDKVEEQSAARAVGEKEQQEQLAASRRNTRNMALETLFAKRVALSEEEKTKPKILIEDPEYAKYFKMQKLGLPRASIVQALERDGKDVNVIDLDPNLSLAEQGEKMDELAAPDNNAALKALFSKRSAEMKAKEEAPDKTAALKALFAKRSMAVVAVRASDQEEVLDRNVAYNDLLAKHSPVTATAPEQEEVPDVNTALKALFAKHSVAAEPEKDETPDKNLALEALFAKRPAVAASVLSEQEKEKAPNKSGLLKALSAKHSAAATAPEQDNVGLHKNSALKALFAKRSAAAATTALDQESAAPALKADPEFEKYMKMLQVGMPKEAVRQALGRDRKDLSVVDMDPEKSYASQAKKNDSDSDPPLKEDYAKFFKMLKMGIPGGAVRQALQKEGKDPNIVDMDPEKSYSRQVKRNGGCDETKIGPPLNDDPEFSKFFKMLKMGIPNGAVRQALQKEGKNPDVADMDPEKSYASQVQANSVGDKTKASPLLKDDPEYSKFFKMLKMGIPLGAVQNALKKEGKDTDIVNMDPEKSYDSQVKRKNEDISPLLKDDPEFSKFFKMLKMGIPLGAVQNALKKEGKDPNIITMDPEKSLSQQPSNPKDVLQPSKPKGPKIVRKRLHWNKIDESKLHKNSFWNQATRQSSLQLVGLDIDNEEFASLFTSPLNKPTAPKKLSKEAKKSSSKQNVQLIDSRRRMNGSILLTKFKVDYKVLAKQVDNMEVIESDANELRGMMQLLPTKDESLALRSYLPPLDAPQSEIEKSILKLGECEQYMAVMLDVFDVKDKFQCMLIRAEFENHLDNVRDGTKMLIQACECVRNSERFRKLLLYALKLGNALNTGGANQEVKAITVDSLLKLAEAKAFDRQTSVLHYLVSIVQKNDEDVLKVSEDFDAVKAAERIVMDTLSHELKDMVKGINLVKEVVKRRFPEADGPTDKEDELLGTTPMGQFCLSATLKLQSLSNEFDEAKNNFADLLNFFGEDSTMTPEAFFCTINTFVSMFDQTRKELRRKQEAKERKKRIEEKRKLREQEMAAKKIKSNG